MNKMKFKIDIENVIASVSKHLGTFQNRSIQLYSMNESQEIVFAEF